MKAAWHGGTGRPVAHHLAAERQSRGGRTGRSSGLRSIGGWLWLAGAGCVLCDGFASSGEPEFLRRVWTRENGLPHNTVRALLQTRDGYLWAGTRSGAARFDGQKFFVLSHTDFPVMVSDNCRVLAEDAAGSLWIGTDQGLLRGQGDRKSGV